MVFRVINGSVTMIKDVEQMRKNLDRIQSCLGKNNLAKFRKIVWELYEHVNKNLMFDDGQYSFRIKETDGYVEEIAEKYPKKYRNRILEEFDDDRLSSLSSDTWDWWWTDVKDGFNEEDHYIRKDGDEKILKLVIDEFKLEGMDDYLNLEFKYCATNLQDWMYDLKGELEANLLKPSYSCDSEKCIGCHDLQNCKENHFGELGDLAYRIIDVFETDIAINFFVERCEETWGTFDWEGELEYRIGEFVEELKEEEKKRKAKKLEKLQQLEIAV